MLNFKNSSLASLFTAHSTPDQFSECPGVSVLAQTFGTNAKPVARTSRAPLGLRAFNLNL